MSWRSGPGIAGYEDAALIGEGGFATVYRARQPAFNRLVALKVLSKVRLDAPALRRFDRERAAIGSLSGHPNIVTVYESGLTDDGMPYLAMEYLPGGSLADLLARHGPLPWRQAAHIGVRLAGALESAHQAGILHRDLKPENVLLSSFGEPQLTDFGIARVLGSETRTVNQAVSIAHAAPEVLNGEPFTRQSDVYSLGSTLFTLLWGRPPFLRDDDELLLSLLVRVAREPLPDLRAGGVPDAVCEAIERAMAKQAGERHQSALALATELQDAEAAAGLVPTVPLVVGTAAHAPGPPASRAGEPTAPVARTPVAPAYAPGPPPAVETPPAPRPGRRRRWALLALPLVVAVAVLAAAQAGREPSGSNASPPDVSSTTATSSTTTSTTTTTLAPATDFPTGTDPLRAGRYRAPRFATPFEFAVPDGWRATTNPNVDFLELTRTGGDGSATVAFLRVATVIDPQRAPLTRAETQDALLDPPADLVQWIRGHPRLSAGAATPVSKGALPGSAVDAQPTLGYLQQDCVRTRPGRRCVLLFVAGTETFYALSEGFRVRFHVLRVGDDTLVAAIEAPTAQFDAFAADADQVLATLGPGR